MTPLRCLQVFTYFILNCTLKITYGLSSNDLTHLVSNSTQEGLIILPPITYSLSFTKRNAHNSNCTGEKTCLSCRQLGSDLAAAVSEGKGGAANTSCVISLDLEAAKSKVKMLTCLVSGENPPPSSLMAVLLHVLTWQQEGGSSLGTLILRMRAPPSWPNHLPKAPPPNTITLSVRV